MSYGLKTYSAGTDLNNGVYLGSGRLVGKKAGLTTFAVDTTVSATFGGTLSVVWVSGNARLEVSNNVIKAYDGTGTLRVKIGNLTA